MDKRMVLLLVASMGVSALYGYEYDAADYKKVLDCSKATKRAFMDKAFQLDGQIADVCKLSRPTSI